MNHSGGGEWPQGTKHQLYNTQTGLSRAFIAYIKKNTQIGGMLCPCFELLRILAILDTASTKFYLFSGLPMQRLWETVALSVGCELWDTNLVFIL